MKKSNFAALLKKARDLEVKATQPDEQLKCTDNCGCVLGGEYAMICGKVTSKPQLPSKSALKPSSSVPELLVDVVRTDSNASNSSARNRVTFLSAQVDTGAKGGLYEIERAEQRKQGVVPSNNNPATFVPTMEQVFPNLDEPNLIFPDTNPVPTDNTSSAREALTINLHDPVSRDLLAFLDKRKIIDLASYETSSETSDGGTSVDSASSKKSDLDIRRRVVDQPISDFQSMKCTASCKANNGECCRLASVGQVIALRKDIWDDIGEEDVAVTRKLRAAKFRLKLTQASRQSENVFEFLLPVSCPGDKAVRVCEYAYLQLSGVMRPDRLITDPKKRGISSAPSAWVQARKDIVDRISDAEIAQREKDRRADTVDTPEKFIDARTFILEKAQEYGDLSPEPELSNIIIAPFDSVQSFYLFYQQLRNEEREVSRDDAEAKEPASLSTFRRAFRSLNDKVRLLTAKGSFKTCSVCNVINNLLNNADKRVSSDTRTSLLNFKTLHLKMQKAERDSMEERKRLALNKYDKNGNPEYAFLFADGMTVQSSDTPKEGTGKRLTKIWDGHTISSRLMAVEVKCGPVDTHFVYSMDDTVQKGSNVMVEVMRQAFVDLAKLLAEQGHPMPKQVFLQFDNCTENKNKAMFVWLSALVELEIFDKVHINFLIVGHTHASIDQFFSVLKKDIDFCRFIGSPLSLLYMLKRRGHPFGTDKKRFEKCTILVARQLEVVYDVYKPFKEICNTAVKYFLVPHCFVISRYQGTGVAITQYKVFSLHSTWLPKLPDDSVAFASRRSTESVEQFQQRAREFMLNEKAGEVMIESLRELFGGAAEIDRQFGIDDTNFRYDEKSQKAHKMLHNASEDIDTLLGNVANKLIEGWQEFCDENPSEVTALPRDTSKERKALIDASNKRGGFLIWIRPPSVVKGSRGQNQEFIADYLANLRPTPLDPSKITTPEMMANVSAKIRNQIANAVEAISKSASYMVGKVCCDQPLVRLNERDTFDYMDRTICRAELEYYTTRSTPESFYAYLEDAYAKAPQWQPVPPEVLALRPRREFVAEAAAQVGEQNELHMMLAVHLAAEIQLPENQEVIHRQRGPNLPIGAAAEDEEDGVPKLDDSGKKTAPKRKEAPSDDNNKENKPKDNRSKKQRAEDEKKQKILDAAAVVSSASAASSSAADIPRLLQSGSVKAVCSVLSCREVAHFHCLTNICAATKRYYCNAHRVHQDHQKDVQRQVDAQRQQLQALAVAPTASQALAKAQAEQTFRAINTDDLKCAFPNCSEAAHDPCHECKGRFPDACDFCQLHEDHAKHHGFARAARQAASSSSSSTALPILPPATSAHEDEMAVDEMVDEEGLLMPADEGEDLLADEAGVLMVAEDPHDYKFDNPANILEENKDKLANGENDKNFKMALYLVKEMFAAIHMGGNIQLGLEQRLMDSLVLWSASEAKLKVLRLLFDIEDAPEGVKSTKGYFVQQYLERFRNFIVNV